MSWATLWTLHQGCHEVDAYVDTTEWFSASFITCEHRELLLPACPHQLPSPSLRSSGPGWKEAHWGQAGGEGEAAGASEWPGHTSGHRELAGPGA